MKISLTTPTSVPLKDMHQGDCFHFQEYATKELHMRTGIYGIDAKSTSGLTAVNLLTGKTSVFSEHAACIPRPEMSVTDRKTE
jgi:hypothetical protein